MLRIPFVVHSRAGPSRRTIAKSTTAMWSDYRPSSQLRGLGQAAPQGTLAHSRSQRCIHFDLASCLFLRAQWQQDSSWGTCSLTCSIGTHTKNVWCRDLTNSVDVADAYCLAPAANAGAKPISQEPCGVACTD